MKAPRAGTRLRNASHPLLRSPGLARAITRILAGMICSTLVACASSDDPAHAAEMEAIASSGHPLAGFWKKDDCAQHFGLAITPDGSERYAVFFCGVDGCTKQGNSRPGTTIVYDPLYRVIDSDTLDVKVADGFVRYVRCPSRQ